MTTVYPLLPRCIACFQSNTSPVSVGGHTVIVCHEEDCGLISMLDRKTTQVYDEKYVAERYDRYPTTDRMSVLRASLVETLLLLHESFPEGLTVPKKGSLLDVGYGNGSFIRECQNRGWSAFGNDVNPTPYPGVERRTLPNSEHYRAITFFDALEHFESLNEVQKVSLNTDWIICSYPRLPDEFIPGISVDCLTEWKHFRPGEHHHFFTPQSLARLFTNSRCYAELVYTGYPEDWIRGKGKHGQPNIETVALRIRKRAC